MYAWQQMRVAYRQPGWLEGLKLSLLFIGILASHSIYRLLQFLLVLAMT